MPIKSALILSSFFVILNSQSHVAWAAFDSPTDEEENISVMQSKHDMAPLLEGRNEIPLMRETVASPKMKLSAGLKMMATEERAQDYLDQEATAALNVSDIDNKLIDDATMLNWVNKLRDLAALPFQSKLTAELKSVAFEENVQSYLDQEAPAVLNASDLDNNLMDEVLMLGLSSKLMFSPPKETPKGLSINTSSTANQFRDELKKESIREELAKQFLKLDFSPFFYQVIEN
jgi:hypothetical protein